MVRAKQAHLEDMLAKGRQTIIYYYSLRHGNKCPSVDFPDEHMAHELEVSFACQDIATGDIKHDRGWLCVGNKTHRCPYFGGP